jgi:hypothetical protein
MLVINARIAFFVLQYLCRLRRRDPAPHIAVKQQVETDEKQDNNQDRFGGHIFVYSNLKRDFIHFVFHVLNSHHIFLRVDLIY